MDAKFFQHKAHIMALRLGFIVTDITNVQDDICCQYLFQRGAK